MTQDDFRTLYRLRLERLEALLPQASPELRTEIEAEIKELENLPHLR